MKISIETDRQQWAEEVFGGNSLPDERLSRRLVAYAAAQANDPRASTAGACKGDVAAREGAYRFLENERVLPEDIEVGAFQHTVELCRGRERVLAVQDSTGISVKHQPLAEALKEYGSPTGFMVHSTLAIDGGTGEVLGLLDQARWLRDKNRPSAKDRYERPYGDKESYKWERAERRAVGQLHTTSNVITVGDRESDIFELIQYFTDATRRFVIRASLNRRVAGEMGNLWSELEQAPCVGERTVSVGQRGGQQSKGGQSARSARAGREATVKIRAAPVWLRPPKTRSQKIPPIGVNAVFVTEPSPPPGVEPLCWRLLTSEPISTSEDVIQVVQDYEKRWKIEEFHKCWKSGCRVEERALQSIEAVERMMVILAPIAVLIMQLHTLANNAPDESCTNVLDEASSRCLWHHDQGTPFPSEPPSAQWALHAVAKLGGWYDSKRTGRIGWTAIWKGWMLLQERAIGWRVAMASVR
jgi:hypothetical protein